MALWSLRTSRSPCLAPMRRRAPCTAWAAFSQRRPSLRRRPRSRLACGATTSATSPGCTNSPTMRARSRGSGPLWEGRWGLRTCSRRTARRSHWRPTRPRLPTPPSTRRSNTKITLRCMSTLFIPIFCEQHAVQSSLSGHSSFRILVPYSAALPKCSLRAGLMLRMLRLLSVHGAVEPVPVREPAQRSHGGRGAQSLTNYLDNLLIIRAAAKRHGLEFWNYFGAAAFQGHTVVTEVQMRQQMMVSITAVAKGLLYWVAGVENAGGWATAPRLGRHWHQARRLNSVVQALGPTLMQLSSDSVVRVHANATPGSGLPADGLVTLVQETLGCSVNTPSDVINDGGANVSDNPQCVGNFHYVRCPGVQAATVPLPLAEATVMANFPGGWCLDDVVSELECSNLCDALRQPRAASVVACASFDWESAGKCCVNPSGTHLTTTDRPGAVHVAKVHDAELWTCPHITPAGCPPNNTHPPCAGYGGEPGSPVVGHDLLLSTATHTDGRRAITLMNWDGVFTAAPTIVIPSATVNTTASPTKLPLIEIDPITGHEVLAVDDIPELPGLQLVLEAGEARLFLIGVQ
eukprot:m.260878 g.260878  ORF g.260878 m.260878 type:complete len:576 (+) comp26653_c0_seq2:155-1882(+)